MTARRAAEPTTANVGALGLGLLRNFRRRRGDVGNALVRCRAPLSTEKILLVLRIVEIVRHGIKGAKRRVVIPYSLHIVIVPIVIVRADGRRLIARPATGRRPSG